MKPATLDSHDRALAQIITAQNAAALALQRRISVAERIVASFAAAPTEAALAAAVAAQSELDALGKLNDALPDPAHREQALRDDYCRRYRDDILDVLTGDLSNRIKPRPAWRRTIAGEIARLSELMALREAPAAELAAASTEADRLDNALADSDHDEREARRSIATFASEPTFQNLNDARGSIEALKFQ